MVVPEGMFLVRFLFAMLATINDEDLGLAGAVVVDATESRLAPDFLVIVV